MTRKHFFLVLLAAFISMAGYVAASRHFYGPGFPLDDAWIHQTYARNLASHGEWAYLPGEPSAGSTAPAWSAMLAAGYGLRLNPQFWAFLLGWSLLAGLGWVAIQGMRWLCPQSSGWSMWAAGALVLEWHLVWAALSGMETLLYALLALSVLVMLVGMQRGTEPHALRRTPQTWLGLGALIGFGVWVRPDAITLLAPVGLFIALSGGSLRHKALGMLACLAGCAFFIVPYLLLNQQLAGAWLPNTFFAKQAEYAVHRQASLWLRFGDQFKLPLVGVGALLFPGFCFLLARSFFQRSAAVALGGVWALGYLALYAWRLPVTYQHGRYIMPAMPVFFLWGLAGLAGLLLWTRRRKWPYLLARAWALSAALVLGVFWLVGARAYAWDVAIIQTEMVETARWIRQNTPSEAVIAAHDIGALGYFAGRPLIDLAGLVSPEVIPFIRDEAALQEYLDREEVDYLVTFPGWYPSLVKELPVLFASSGGFGPQLDGENMTVFLWK